MCRLKTLSQQRRICNLTGTHPVTFIYCATQDLSLPFIIIIITLVGRYIIVFQDSAK
jgi:hypothetical protein